MLRDGRVEAVDNANAALALALITASTELRFRPVVACDRYRQSHPDLAGSTLDNARVTEALADRRDA